ncbi:unnamed protein product [Amoebophrya sp. A25]|nr:unnamed protein product [Amoebophrya sp. A25]|eukprot:GSA25T00022297001.1
MLARESRKPSATSASRSWKLFHSSCTSFLLLHFLPGRNLLGVFATPHTGATSSVLSSSSNGNSQRNQNHASTYPSRNYKRRPSSTSTTGSHSSDIDIMLSPRSPSTTTTTSATLRAKHVAALLANTMPRPRPELPRAKIWKPQEMLTRESTGKMSFGTESTAVGDLDSSSARRSSGVSSSSESGGTRSPISSSESLSSSRTRTQGRAKGGRRSRAKEASSVGGKSHASLQDAPDSLGENSQIMVGNQLRLHPVNDPMESAGSGDSFHFGDTDTNRNKNHKRRDSSSDSFSLLEDGRQTMRGHFSQDYFKDAFPEAGVDAPFGRHANHVDAIQNGLRMYGDSMGTVPPVPSGLDHISPLRLSPEPKSTTQYWSATEEDGSDHRRSNLRGRGSSPLEQPGADDYTGRRGSGLVFNPLEYAIQAGQQDGAFNPKYKNKMMVPDYQGPPVSLSEKVIAELETTPHNSQNLYSEPWSARWKAIQRLGSGAFGEAWLVQNLANNALAVMKRIPRKGYEGQYLRWSDFGASSMHIDDAIEGLRDECGWAASLQRFGQKFRYASRFLFMQCMETNIAPRFARTHPASHHELYVIVNYGGQRLDKVAFTTKEALLGVLSQLSMALHYLQLSGIVHHDLKSANIMYSENLPMPDNSKQLQVDRRGHQSSGTNTTAPVVGHVVVIDFGGMINHNDSPEVFLNAPHTPGFAPKEFDDAIRGLGRVEKQRNGPAFDTFSMAGVMSEIILGENLIYRFVQTGRFGRLPFKVDWRGWNTLVGDANAFKNFVFHVARNAKTNAAIRERLLREIDIERPKFFDWWRQMWSVVIQTRVEAADGMWKMLNNVEEG